MNLPNGKGAHLYNVRCSAYCSVLHRTKASLWRGRWQKSLIFDGGRDNYPSVWHPSASSPDKGSRTKQYPTSYAILTLKGTRRNKLLGMTLRFVFCHSEAESRRITLPPNQYFIKHQFFTPLQINFYSVKYKKEYKPYLIKWLKT